MWAVPGARWMEPSDVILGLSGGKVEMGWDDV